MGRVEFSYKPLRVHQPFHESAAEERLLFGAVGSGKSYAVCSEAILWCLEQPGIRGILTRKTIPELKDSTEAVFFDLLPHEIYTRGKTSRVAGHVDKFIFPNGSEVLFKSIDDWKKYKSYNLGFIGWDELDEFDEETYTAMVDQRLRQKDPTAMAAALGAGPIRRRGSWGASNPEGHNWLWKLFVKDQDRGKEVFKSTSFDNAHLPPDYLVRLLDMPEPWVRRYVLCQFDDFAGQIYEEWDWNRHVISPFKNELGEYSYPENLFWMALDPGTRNPTGGLWVYVDKAKHRLVGVAEYLEAGLAADVHARSWRSIEARHRMNVAQRVADPSIRVRDRSTNNSLEDTLRRLGFRFALGPIQVKDRVPILGNLIHRGQFVITSECPQTFESIRDYRWRDLSPAQRARGEDPPEEPLKKETELVECAQYIASRYQKPTPLRKNYDGEDWSAELRDMVQGHYQRLRRPPPRPMVEGIPV